VNERPCAQVEKKELALVAPVLEPIHHICAAFVSILRDTLRSHRHLAVVIVLLALAFKAAVPAGFMIETRSLTLTMAICADATGGHVTRQIVVPRSDQPAPADSSKGSATCPFAALGLGLLADELPVFAAAALVFILLTGLAPAYSPRLRRHEFQRPPLRAPPALA